MNEDKVLDIAILPGDGVGHELLDATLQILAELERNMDDVQLNYTHIRAGAAFYQETGEDITGEDFERARAADAILLGAMGHPDVRYPDGTEIAPHLTMRTEYDLFASVRPVKAYPNIPQPLADPRAGDIDLVIIRECSEGLFYLRHEGQIIDDREARDTLVMTRKGCERLFDFAFNLSRQRKESGGKGMVSCVDKSNVLRSFAFFRKIFTERAELYPDITADYRYVDAMALDLIRKPWDYDILVAENMFADILSDQGGGIIGGMGMAPCAELGENHGIFQPAHGSAPDIAGQDKANPTATFLSAAMMLRWLGTQHDLVPCTEAAEKLEKSIEQGFSSNRIQPMEFGGPHGTKAVRDTVLSIINDQE